ncbi:methyl-accepting chemotaxis protein [Reinekea sp.]|uniref:methyl-accepting chemotaxis protein n=1 Tax=Reinekea sp. TaxID=1970455 RepID=UPI003988AF38
MKKLTIQLKLTIGTVFAVLIMQVITGVIGFQQSKTLLENTVQYEINTAGQTLVRSIDAWQSSKLAVLNSTGQFTTSSQLNDVLLQGAQAGGFLYMYLGSEQGKMIIQPFVDLPADYDPRTRPWYQDAVKSSDPILTAPYVDAASGELVMSFAQAVSNGVIASDIAMTDVVNSVVNLEFGETGQAMLVDASNNVLVHKNIELIGKSIDEIFQGGKVTDEISEVTNSGQAMLVAGYAIKDTPWRVIISIQKSDALSGLSQLIVQTLLLSVITLVVVAVVLIIMIKVSLAPLANLAKSMRDIASGDADLTRRIPVTSEDELGQLSRYFNNFIESIHSMVIQVIDSAAQMQVLSKESHQVSTENNNQVHQQQSEIAQVAAAIHEMSAIAASVAENAAHTAEAAENAQKETQASENNANQNKAQMGELTHEIDTTTDVIDKLNQHAQQIATILATIQGIAEQTNLLALNAAIEAARAGEQGRGFAVVADEVRALSGRTHEATGEIQTMIEALKTQTQAAVSQMGRAKSLVENTMEAANKVSVSQANINLVIQGIKDQALSISSSSQEQNLATDEINRITQAIQEAAHELASNVTAAHQQAEELDALGLAVQAQLTRFRT